MHDSKVFAPVSTLPRGARRLLAALAEPGARAIADPSRDDGLILAGGERGVSLGRGCHPQAAARELLANDLVERSGAAYVASATGIAHHRRLLADPRHSPFEAQHRDLVEEEVGTREGASRVVKNANESPLDWLRRRKGADGQPLIDAASYEAGERLRRDLTIGGMLPSISARWDGALGQGGGRPRDPAAAADAVIAARQRVRRALETLGADGADLLVDLCGFLKGLEQIERERRWPPRSGKIVIGLALRRLAEHYGLEVEARGPARSSGIRIWHAGEAGDGNPCLVG